MNKTKRERLRKAGWSVGDAADFLQLTREESIIIDLKLAFARELKRRRTSRGTTQAELAAAIGSSQSRVAKMEAADPGVSLDLLVHALLAAGATRTDIASVIDPRRARRARSSARGAA